MLIEYFGSVKNKPVVDVFVVNCIKKLKLERLRVPVISISFVSRLDCYGLCSGSPKRVEIEISKHCPTTGRKLGFMEMMHTLGHELIHARQIIRRELTTDGEGFRWKSRRANGYRYENQPWELEAYRQEDDVLMKCFPWNMNFNN